MINTCSDAAPVVAEIPRADSMLEVDEIAAVTPAAETETRYSWFYYERED